MKRTLASAFLVALLVSVSGFQPALALDRDMNASLRVDLRAPMRGILSPIISPTPALTLILAPQPEPTPEPVVEEPAPVSEPPQVIDEPTLTPPTNESEPESPVVTPTPAEPTSSAMISFNIDDGWTSGYEAGLPLFDAAGIKVTYFPISTYFGYESYITSDQLKSVQERGHEIGIHTRTHPHLTQLSPQQAHDEIFGAKEDLEKMGIGATSFAYPYGEWNEPVKNIVQEAGFTNARGTDGANADYTSDPYVIPSWNLDSTMTFEQAKLVIDDAIAHNTWAIFTIHKVDNSGEPESISPMELEGIIKYVQEKGVRTVTNSEGATVLGNI